jgi:hypothetical protein
MDEIKDGKTRRRRKKVSDYGKGNECNRRECDACFETIKLKKAKVEVKKSEPIITQATVEAMLELSGGRLSSNLLNGEATQLEVETDTIYAKDTQLTPDTHVYAEEQPLYKSK